ncbi:CD74 molecule, major histocompatibility complex, class II invariant chain a [Corythoichthys intestinalis]|uniref:CD74 molecule, major histocompatibility complex, class II invariant chain a n=1 Tax=Corythoichthys intestinalis TaxID=161448 RepID=UPI0025A62D3F|nr:CD74 molecule, major histocompatibility complex, class II invariant chain a [Corythoichthys intestinalis]XP_057706235.1 CD74 molecule, major histocompatibility complex, class II invariant chain a [Corythoichthys intestinalis]
MEENGENAPLARAGSAEPLVRAETSGRSANRYALKVAGLTTLGCLLVASQVFVGFMVFNQKQQIRTLQKDSDQMLRQLHAAQVAPVKLRDPMNVFPLMHPFADFGKVVTKAPVKQKEKKMDSVGVDEMIGLMEENFELPKFNDNILGNLQSLKKQLNHSSWESFESWLRNWIIFNMSQNPPTTPTASSIKTKCQMNAEVHSSRVGSFHPVCDAEGLYKATQCWPAVGVCWCVDVDSGAAIEGTATTQGRPDCQ